MTTFNDVWDNALVLFNMWPFSENTAANQVSKMDSEVLEFIQDPSLAEAADIGVVLVGWALKSGYTREQLLTAINDKLEINTMRTWTRQPDGTLQHD